MHAEAVLLVDDHEREVVELHRLLEQRMRADENVDLAGLEFVENGGALAALLAAGQQRDAQARGCGEAFDGLQVLAGEQLGGRHQRGLRAGFDRRRHGEQRHHRLAAADIALQQTQHAVRAGEIGIDLAQAPTLRLRKLEGQASDDGAPELARCGEPPPGAPAEPSADDGERQLVGKQFVVGQPLPGRGGGLQVRRRLRRMLAPKA